MGYDWDQFNRAIQSRGPLDINAPWYGTVYDQKNRSNYNKNIADQSEVRGQTIDYDLNPERILSNMPGRSWTGGARTGKGEGLVFDLENDSSLRDYAKQHGIVRLEQDADGNITPYFKNKRSARIFNELRVQAMEDLVNNKEMTFANRSDDTFVSTAEDRLRNKANAAEEQMDIKDFYKEMILRNTPPAVGSPEWEKYKEWQLELEGIKDRRRMQDLGAAQKMSNRRGATNTVAAILKSLVN